MSDTALIALAAAAVGAEATGVTNVTGAFDDSGDGDDEVFPGSDPPAFAGFGDALAGLGEGLGAAVDSGRDTARSGQSTAELLDAIQSTADTGGDVIDATTAVYETTSSDDPFQVITDPVGSFGDGVRDGATDETRQQTGVDTRSGTGALDAIGRFAADPSGTAESAGEEVGRTPVAFGGGVVDGGLDELRNTWETGEEVGESILETVTPGDGRPATGQEVLRGDADLSDATVTPMDILSTGTDAVTDTADAVTDSTDVDDRIQDSVSTTVEPDASDIPIVGDYFDDDDDSGSDTTDRYETAADADTSSDTTAYHEAISDAQRRFTTDADTDSEPGGGGSAAEDDTTGRLDRRLERFAGSEDPDEEEIDSSTTVPTDDIAVIQ